MRSVLLHQREGLLVGLVLGALVWMGGVAVVRSVEGMGWEGRGFGGEV